MRLHVEVTQADIRKAIRLYGREYWSESCPIACALYRSSPGRAWKVDPAYGIWDGGFMDASKAAPLPDEARDFANEFDGNFGQPAKQRRMKPFSFDIDLPIEAGK